MMNGGIDGYDFCGSSSTHPSGNKTSDSSSAYDYEINLKQGNTKEVDVALQFNPAADKGAIASGKYYVLLEATSQDGNNKYYNVVAISADGNDELVYLPVSDTWSDGQKYSENWSSVTASIITPASGKTLTTGGNKPQPSDYESVYMIGDYSYTFTGYSTSTDDDNHVTHQTYTFKLSKYEFEDALTPEVVTGPGVNFGVTAEEFAQTGHMQTNFATNNYSGQGDDQVNVQPDLSNEAGSIVASKITGQIYMNAPDRTTPLVYTSNPEKVIGHLGNVVLVNATEQRIKSTIVDPILNHGKSMSDYLASKSPTLVPTITSEKLNLDFTSFPDGKTIYLDADAFTNKVATNGDVSINMLPNQTVVFNFKDTSALTVNGADIKVNGTKASEVFKAEHLVYNLNKATDVKLNDAFGMFLIPSEDSTTTITTSSEGWVITGGKFTSENQTNEWHFRYKHVVKTTDSVLVFEKRVDNILANKDQIFEFELLRCTNLSALSNPNGASVEPQWETVATLTNSGSGFTYTVPFGMDNRVYKIVEKGKADSTEGNYTLDGHEYFAVIRYVGDAGQLDTVTAAYPVYFDSLEKALDVYVNNPVGNDGDSLDNGIVFLNKTREDVESGKLTVAKAVSGADAAQSKVFKFTVKQANGDKYVQADGSLDATEYEFTVKAGASNAVTISDIPVGDYEVAEVADSANIDGYALTASGGGAVSVTTTGTASSTLTNAYERQTANDTVHDSVTVKKTDGANPLEGATFTLFDASGTAISTYGGAEKSEFTISTEDEALKNYLPAVEQSVELTLKETTAPTGYLASSQTWTVTISATVGAEQYDSTRNAFVTTTTYTMTIDGGQSLTVANQAVGKLEVSKTVEGCPDAEGKTFKFTVKQADGDKYVQANGSLGDNDYQFDVKQGTPAEISNVPVGSYLVSEIIEGTKVAGYTLTTPVETNATIETGKIAKATLTNTYNRNEKSETEHSKVTVTKTDGTHSIDGATFTLFDGETAVKTYSGGTFDIKTEDLAGVLPAVGSADKELTLKETAAPTGYRGSTDSWKVKISAAKVGPTLVDDTFVTTVKYAITVAGDSSLTVVNQELGSLRVTKQVTGDSPAVTGKSFEFTVQPEGQTGANGKYVQRDGSISDTEYKFSIEAGAAVDIDNIPAGSYVVKEALDSAQVEGYVVNASVVPDGNIEVSKTAPVAVTITNTYRHITDDLKGKKSIEVTAGDAKELADDQFEFSIVRKQATDPDGVYEADLISSAKNKGNGEIDFGTVAFTKPGTYVYEVKETSSSASGFTKDDAVYTVAYVVADDMSFTKTIKAGEVAANEIAFTNTYTAAPVTLNFAGEKTLPGKTLGDKQFSFKMEGTSDNAKGTVKAAQNAADGTISFGEIGYTAPGVYEYKVTEVEGSEPGVGYDNTEYTVVVTVSDNGRGALTASAKVDNGEAQTSGVVTGLDFANTVLVGTAQLSVTKFVEGASPNSGEEFEFTLAKEDGSTTDTDVLPNPATVGVAAGGTASFGDIAYNQAGTYYYTITETRGSTPSMNYDTAPKYAKVVVDRNTAATGDTLVATSIVYADSKAALETGGTAKLEVTNTYETVEVKGSKIWVDNNNELDQRPDSVTVQLQSKSGDDDWTDVKDKTATITGANLSYNFGKLPKYADKECKVEIQYRVIDKVDGYTTSGGTSAESYELTNEIVDKKADAEQPVTLTLHKTGANGAVLPGATFTLTDSNKGTKAYTTNDEGNITITFTEQGNWTLQETDAPAGYVLDDTTYAITVTRDENPIKVEFYQGAWTSFYNLIFGSPVLETGNILNVTNDQTKVSVSKVDIANSEEVSGATIQILATIDGKEKIVDEWKSETGVKHEVSGLLVGVEYTLHETVAPDGYTIATDTTFTIDENGQVTYSGKNGESGELLVQDAKTKVSISKVDIANSKEVEGATIQILDADGNEIESWTSGKQAHVVEGLKTGVVYTLHEKVAPEGYTIATDTMFTIDENGVITYSGNKNKDGVLLVEDTQTSVKVSKVDVADGEEVAGATIQIIDSKGEVFEEWISTEEAHEVKGLKVGETYTLHEEAAPEGYVVATDTTFVIDEEGNVTSTGTINDDGVLLVEDAKTKVKVSKTDIADGEELEGAHIQVLDKDGNIVEEWDSTTKAHEVEGLKTGEEYTLRETVAPKGYTVTTDTTFKIDEKGNVTSTGSVSEDGTLLVEDAQTSVKVSKIDVAGGKEIAGAKIQIKDKDGNVVEEWVSKADDESTKDVNEGIHEVKGLHTGETYTLHEEVAPDGYTIATDTTFIIDEEGNVTSTGVVNENGVMHVEDAKTQVKVSKVDAAGGKELAGATIQILDESGKVVTEWTSVVDDKATEDVNEAIHVVEGLKTGVTYTLKETVAPDGYTIATATTFKIDEEGNVTTTDGSISDEGVLLVEDSLTSVSVSKVDVAGGKEVVGAKIQILDSEKNVVAEWTSTEEAHEVKGLKTGETYTLHEEVAPEGYIIAADTTFTIGTDGKVASTGTITEDGVMLVEDAQTSVKVSKYDVTNDKELAGATIQIIDKDGNVVEEWVSKVDDKATEDVNEAIHEVKGLKVGVEYTLHEEVAPNGYTLATDTTFTIDENGKVTSEKATTKNGVLLVEDELAKVNVSKVDAGTGDEVAGATIQVLDKATGETVDEWTSTDKPHGVNNVETGKTYILKETVAPDGYTITSEIEFTINEDGSVTTEAKTKDGVILVEDAKTKVKVSKTDIADGEELEGAHIQVLDKDGNIVEEWDSTIKAHEVEGLKTGEEYTLRETVAPKGYTVTTDTKFTIDETGKVTSSGSTSEDGTLLIEDAQTSVKVSKVDVAGGKEIAGAKIQIKDKDGNVVEEWVSKADDEATKDVNEGIHEVNGLHTGETYTLHEEVAPDGYTIAADTTFTIDETGKVDSAGTITEDGVLLIEDSKTSIKVSKTDIAGSEELEGAKIQILDESGKVVEEWTSGKEAHEVTGLKTGVEYTLHEEVAPDGYTVATDTTFTIGTDGKVTTTGSVSEDGTLLIKDALTKVKVSKVDIADGKELEGAHIQILDADGKVVEEWDSAKEAHVVDGLKTGVEYTLKETVAPEGYTIATATTFTIATDGAVTTKGPKSADGSTLLVEDAMTKISVKKTDIADGEELEGAHIQILDKEGHVVDEWDSTKDAHEVTGLKTGEEYTLKETVAPDGYTITTDTKFTIDETGKVTSTGSTSENGELLVEDAKTKVKVSKTDIASGEELEGAHIQIIDSKDNVVEEWDSTDKAHEVEGLKTGEKYTLKETVAPDGYTIATETTFTIDETGKVTSTGNVTDDGVLLVEDAKTSVKVSKTDIADGEELEGAKIQILGKDGKVVEEWTSGKEAHEITGLKTGVEYTLHEEVAPDGYSVATDTTFTIDEKGKVTTTATTNEDGVILIEDAITTVSVSKVDAAGGKELAGATIQILDKDGKVVEEWISTTEVHVVKGLTADATYTLKETVAPDGYTVAAETKFTIAKDGKVTSEGTTTEDGVLLIEDSLTKVKVSKTDIADGEELEGATIQLIDKEGTIVEEWVSGKEAHEITGLKTGEEYTLRETVAPEGYTVTTDTKFTIDETGKVTSTGSTSEDGTLLVEDAKTKVKVSKTDIADGKELEGATIQILDKDGKVVDEWASTKDIHEVEGLKTGEEYTLRETVAPDYYDVATDTTFTIDETGKVTTTGTVTEDGVLLVEDARLTGKLSVEKYLTGTTTRVTGASLCVVEKSSGSVVDEWTTGSSVHEIAGLEAGKTYILKETKVPSGYEKAEDVEFTVSGGSSSSVTIVSGAKLSDGSTNASVSGSTVSLFDAKTDDSGSSDTPGTKTGDGDDDGEDTPSGPSTPKNPTNPVNPQAPNRSNTTTTTTTPNRSTGTSTSSSTSPRTGDGLLVLVTTLSLASLASAGVFVAARRRLRNLDE